jgi:hypothetical protein
MIGRWSSLRFGSSLIKPSDGKVAILPLSLYAILAARLGFGRRVRAYLRQAAVRRLCSDVVNHEGGFGMVDRDRDNVDRVQKGSGMVVSFLARFRELCNIVEIMVVGTFSLCEGGETHGDELRWKA